MKIDLDQAGGGSHYTADVCIAGAGIAGITLAHALLNSGLRVALLEGGGVTPEERSQELCDVEMAGHFHEGAAKGRFRLFGGSSTRWGGQLLPYPEDVFQPPPNTSMQRWPVQSSELEPLYPAVLRVMGAPEERFEPGSVSSGGLEPPAEDADVNVRFSRWASFTYRNLAGTLGKRCTESRNVTLYLHANVTRLERGHSSGDAITQIEATSFTGNVFTFSAKHVVVSLGAIESARLLLVSGIGNDGDQVGRYFHDHISVHAATLKAPVRETAIRVFAPRIHGGVLYTPKLEATARWRERHGAQAVMAHFPIVEPEDSPVATVKMVLQAIQRKQLTSGLLPRLATLPTGSVELLRMAYATKVQKRRALSKRAEYRLNIDVEQHPLPESRITLSNTKDRFGMPRARLSWRISDAEERTVRSFVKTICAELQGVNVAPIELHRELLRDDGDWLSIAADTYHMMGGTRMGTSNENSVVDSNLRVHGIQNLYVASCSVFPGGGSSNPTFTLMALVLRLAERLRSQAMPGL